MTQTASPGPTRLHHHATVTDDQEATRRFYEDVIGMPLVATSLSLAWPTSDGYSNLIVDMPRTGGTFVFNLLAATQVVHDLDAANT